MKIARFAVALLAQFACLQLLDLVSTLAFLRCGVAEANPVIRALTAAAGSPLWGLVAAKALAMLLGWYCWKSGRLHLLGRANLFFAALVGWNLIAIAAQGFRIAN